MKKTFENSKLEFCMDELKTLLIRFQEGNDHTTAEVLFNHVAHIGVETDSNQERKQKLTRAEFHLTH